MIDAGASAILGHHSHIPRGVEYYKGRPILYSLAHLIFSGAHPSWVDNFVARLIIEKHAISRVEIIPVSGKMKDLGQPHVLQHARATQMLSHLQSISRGLGGAMRIDNDIGVLTEH
jgi:poly-gamma-glutamate synthesis protein (capsule biosynthesis protein)